MPCLKQGFEKIQFSILLRLEEKQIDSITPSSPVAYLKIISLHNRINR